MKIKLPVVIFLAFVIGGYFYLNLGYLMSFLTRESSSRVMYLIIFIFYLSLTLLVMLEKENLAEFHLDRATLLVAIIFGIIRISNRGINDEILYKAAVFLITLILAYISMKNWQFVPKTNWAWFGMGLLSCLFIFPLAFVDMFNQGKYDITLLKVPVWVDILRGLLTNLAFTTPIEEIVFRGMLWGYLRRVGCSENAAFWVQFGLFWSVHLWQIGFPISFFITIPLSILVMGLLTKYSKQLFPSLVYHTFQNAMIPALVYLLKR